MIRIHRDREESSLYTTGWHWRMDRLGGYRFYSSLIAHGRKLLLEVLIQNQSCISFINIFQTHSKQTDKKTLNVPRQIAGLLWFHTRTFEVSAQTDCAQRGRMLGCLWTYGGAGRSGAKPVSTGGHRHLYCNLNRWVPAGREGFSIQRSIVGIICVDHKLPGKYH